MTPHPFIPVPNTARVIFYHTLAGQDVENSLYFRKGSPWTTTELQELADSAFTHWGDIMMPDLHSSMHLIKARAISLETESAPAEDHIGDVPGEDSSAPSVPNGTAFVVKFTTAKRGRSFRGRVYLTGFTMNRLATSGTLSTAARDLFVGNVQEVVAGIETDTGATQVVVSLRQHKAWLTTGEANNVVSISATDVNLDSQRRRLPGRGI